MSEDERERINKMRLDNEVYKKFLGQIDDLLPERVEDIEDLEGWFEEVKWLVRCTKDEVCE